MKYNNNNYKEILEALELPAYWEDRLKSKIHKDSEHSLRVLDEMGSLVSGTAVSHKLYSENKSVRKHAKSIFMKLSSHDSFKFLDNDFDRDFNALDEVRIHKSLVSKSVENPLPLLMRWVNLATNEKYKAYLIAEIAFFNQNESTPQLAELYKVTDSTLVKNSIVDTLGKLSYREVIPLLISDFEYVGLSTQELILDTLGLLGGRESLEFLTVVYSKTSNKERLVKLIHFIYNIDKGGETYLQLKASTKSDFERSIIAYVESGRS
ncbi:HEAT repeat domain-containing protein [Myroides sp. M-43]|uniref:HEAT repeat domain-containing protein n=1 Tax=Myroides oncorhynchi TaxID=2893756 RepID=UPI001E355F45|nr:HEAT repeat domain-containing protein [Myroides oncorhynchi]MCC9044049.1 HEAT repeat domain-containing protein [Myroides oncorhynchi]